MWVASFVLLMRGQFRWGYTGGSRTFERGKQLSSMKTGERHYAEAEGLFTWPTDEPHLIGGLCNGCKTYFFPEFSEFDKPRCPQGPPEEALFSRRGKLASYTIQYFPVPSPFVNPQPFVPFAPKTVALPEGIQAMG